MPPAADKVAAPPNPNSDGLTFRLKDGTRIPLVMLMFLEGETQERLAILAKDRTATFRARCYAATDSRGRLFFEPSRCVFLHRLPAAQIKQVAQDADEQMEQVRQKVVSQGPVCADPDRPCPGFKANELSVRRMEVIVVYQIE